MAATAAKEAAASTPAVQSAPAKTPPAEKSPPAQPTSSAQRPGTPVRTEPAPLATPDKTEPVRAEATPPPKPGNFGWVIWLIVILVIAAGVATWFYSHKSGSTTTAAGTGKHGRRGGEQARIVTAVATRADIPIYVRGLGTVTPLNTVTVQSRVNGQLMKVLYTEGQMVKEGDLLLQIDSRPFQAVLDQDKATQEHDEALLENAKIDLARYQTLWQQNSIPQQTLATQESLVKQDQGTVDSDKAAVEAAQLNVTYCNITAPISGRVGLRLVDVGNYIQATGTSGLVVITQIQPITVIAPIAEDDIDSITGPMKAGQTLEVDAYPRVGFVQNGVDVPKLATGTLMTIDNQIDPTTGTVKLRASFPNADNALFPNQFVNVRVLVNTKKNVVTVPSAAVQSGTSNNTFVYILDTENNTVKLQNVTVGQKTFDGLTTEITKGVNAGDTVVTDGVDKLSNGAKVVVAKPGEETADNGSSTAPGTATGPAPTADAGTTPDSSATPGQAAHHHHKKKPSSDTNAAPAS